MLKIFANIRFSSLKCKLSILESYKPYHYEKARLHIINSFLCNAPHLKTKVLHRKNIIDYRK